MNFEQIENEITGGIYGDAKTGVYTPTLVVGLGGSGIKTLRHLKASLLRHGQGTRLVNLVGIDSDANENHKWPNLPRLDEREIILLPQADAAGLLARARERMRDAAHVINYLPDQHESRAGLHAEVLGKIQTQHGAGQFRRAGRLLFQASVRNGANLLARFGAIRGDMMGMAQILKQVSDGLQVAPGAKIFVVSSLAGGTGAGSLLDCIALLRTVFAGPQDVITVLAFLPGTVLDRDLRNPHEEGRVTRGNAIALLRELTAFSQGALGNYRFKIDHALSFGPFQVFVNDYYLIGDHTGEGLAANSFMELTRAAAQFLYSFLGDGVGAVTASGAINNQIDRAAQGDDGSPRMFSSLGVSSLEYPVQEMAVYGVRHSLASWLQVWLEPKSGQKGEVEAEVESFLGSEPLFLKNFATLRPRLQPPAGELRAATFLTDAALRKEFLTQPDEIFVGKGLAKIRDIDAILEGMSPSFEARAADWLDRSREAVRAFLVGRLAVGAGEARRCTKAVLDAVDAASTAFTKERKIRDGQIDKLAKDIEKLGARIHFWDLWLDRGLRKTFLDRIDTYLSLKVDASVDAYAVTQLASLRGAVVETSAKFEALHGSAAAWKHQNERELRRISMHKEQPGFIQLAIPHERFADWAAGVNVQVPEFVPDSLVWDDILRQAFSLISESYRNALQALDIVTDAKKDPETHKWIPGLNPASVPLFKGTSLAPLATSLKPQKFVAGVFEAGDPWVVQRFPAPQGKQQSTLVDRASNRHSLTCVQTSHGYSAVDWAGFADAEAHYRDDPWYFHALEDYSALPPLQPPTAEEAQTLRCFGLGLMFELILDKRNNFYRNVIYSAQEDAHYFIVASNERSAAASQLVGAQLVKEPGAAMTKVRKEDKIGDSLDAAIATLALPREAAFRAMIDQVVGDFEIKWGRKAARELVTEFSETRLGLMIAKAKDRRDTLEKIAQALREYVAELA
jgi:hypothetical protein